VGGLVSRKKYQHCWQENTFQKLDPVPANSNKRLVARFYQLKISYCLTVQYLKSTKSRPTAERWYCPSRSRTWEHQQKILRAEVL